MESNSSNINDKDSPELMSFANRKAMFTQNLADQQSQYSTHQPPKRRQSTPCIIPPPGSVSRPRVASPGASIVPPPGQTLPASPVASPAASPAPSSTLTNNEATPKMTEPPKIEEKEPIPTMRSLAASSRSITTSNISTPTSSASSFKSPSDTSRGRVIWVKPDVKPSNPLDSRNLTPDQVLSNDEAFKLARERRKSDSAVLYAQKMALKQSSGDIPKVFIPPPPGGSAKPPSSSPSPQPSVTPAQKPEVQKPEAPPASAVPQNPPVVERSVPIILDQTPDDKSEKVKPAPASSNNSSELPKFGSVTKNDDNKEEAPNKDEPVKPQAFKNAFKFFASLGVTQRRYSDDLDNPSEQKEISNLQKSIDSSHRKRANTDVH